MKAYSTSIEELRNLSLFTDYAKQEGIAIGERQGKKRGIEIGEKRGIAIGEKRGIEIGEKRGMEIGEKRGIEKGIAEGIEKGRLEGKIEMVIGLYQSNISASKIADIAEMTAAQVQDILRRNGLL
jgi:predicted HTH domain antitoxin